ncbi:MAG: undecaprenyl-diphosphate phosphatase, partial [Chlamydiota bacterium]
LAIYYNPKPAPFSSKRKFQDVIWIGCMQSFALFPGISRMGSTVSGALLRGWSMQDAIRFSFILAIPTGLGGIGIEYLHNPPSISLLSPNYVVAFFASFITGLFSVRWLFSFIQKRKLLPFAWYCLFLGIFTSIYMYLR